MVYIFNSPNGQHGFFRPTREASKTDHTEFFPDGHGYELVSSVRALVPQKFSVEEELMHVKHVEVKSPHVGVMWKFGRGVISSGALSGYGSPVVMDTNSWTVMLLMHVKCVMSQIHHVSMVWKLGQWSSSSGIILIT
ncbi:hypothetical protein TNCV_1459981 [Trichonephila clavipes]|nr:hypothetical protein TNCV_1459981 [Trichonephila clavipes]